MDTNMTTLQLKTSKTQITTNSRTLIYLGLHGSEAEWMKHESSGMLSLHETSSNSVRSRFFITQPASRNP